MGGGGAPIGGPLLKAPGLPVRGGYPPLHVLSWQREVTAARAGARHGAPVAAPPHAAVGPLPKPPSHSIPVFPRRAGSRP